MSLDLEDGETREIADGVKADLGGDGEVVGIDIDRANRLDLDTSAAVALPRAGVGSRPRRCVWKAARPPRRQLSR